MKIFHFRGEVMNKKVREEVLERSGGCCEICGSYAAELHHITKRKGEENKHSCIMLCFEHHRGTDGVHGKNGSRLDLALKLDLQDRYRLMGYTEEEIRNKMGGKLYVEIYD